MERIRIVKVNKTDAWYGMRKEIEGLVGTTPTSRDRWEIEVTFHPDKQVTIHDQATGRTYLKSYEFPFSFYSVEVEIIED